MKFRKFQFAKNWCSIPIISIFIEWTNWQQSDKKENKLLDILIVSALIK